MTPSPPSRAHHGAWRRLVLRRAKPLRIAAWCYLTLAAACFPAVARAQDRACRDSPDAYRGYTVEDVSIETPLSVETPLGFLFGSQAKLQGDFKEALGRLPLKKDAAFDRRLHSDSILVLQDVFSEQVIVPGQRIRLAFITYRLEACDDAARTLKVVYLVYSSDTFGYVSRIFEKQPDKFTRSLAPGRLSARGSLVNTKHKLLPQPFVGYDRERRLFAGARSSFRFGGGIFDQVDFDLSGSTTSAEAGLSLSGSEDFSGGWLSHLDWRVGYRYFDLPSDAIDLKAGTAVAQLFGASQPLGSGSIVFRFGASVEGGNRQAELRAPTAVPPGPAQLGYGAVKLYTGATLSHGRQSWAASYGLQLGNDGRDLKVDYIKHIFDAGYRARLLRRENVPLRLEAQFTAGAISSINAPAPLAERFFGGSSQRSFIQGDDWVIRSSPLIRSFPQNSLNRIGPGAAVGGENFFSFNLTLSHPVWSRPAVPNEISKATFIRDAIGLELRSARLVTFESYLSDEPDFVAASDDLLKDVGGAGADRIDGNLEELEKAFEPLPALLEELQSRTTPPPSEVLEAVERIGDDPVLFVDLVDEMRVNIKRAKEEKGAFKNLVKALIVGLSAQRPGIVPRLVLDLSDLEQALRDAQLDADAERVNAIANRLGLIQTAMTPKINRLVDYGKIDVAVFRPARAVLKDASKPDDVERVIGRLEVLLQDLDRRAYSLPVVGRAVLLAPTDIKDPAEVAVKVRCGQDPVSRYIFTRLTPETRHMLMEYKAETPPPPDSLILALTQELNRLLAGPSIFDEQRFAEADLTDETERLAARNPQGEALLGLNRALLAEAYPSEISKSRLDELLEPLREQVKVARSALTAATGDEAKTKVDDVRNSIHQLMIGFGALAPAVTTRIRDEIGKLESSLTEGGLGAEAQRLAAEAEQLAAFQKLVRQAFKAVERSDAERKADRDVAYAAQSLDVLFRELNLVEVSPVFMFDAARIGPQTAPGYGGVRYGLGPGVRFSLVTLDFAAGYSFNLNRRPEERSGAFVFSMSISDLFR